jgi:hypothetical protein
MIPEVHDCDRLYLATLAMLAGESISEPIVQYIMERECEYCQWCETCKWLVSGRAIYLLKAALTKEPFIIVLLITVDLLSSKNLTPVHMTSLIHKYGLLDIRYLRVLNVIFYHVAPHVYNHVAGFTSGLIPDEEDLISISFSNGVPWNNMTALLPVILYLSQTMVSQGRKMVLPFKKDFSFQVDFHAMIYQTMVNK